VVRLVDLGVGAVLGAGVGAGGGLLLGWSRRRDLSTRSTRSLGVLVLPILAYCLVALVGGNSFVACFVAGTAFTAAASWVDDEESALDRTEGLSELLGFAVWLVFGLAVFPLIRAHIGWPEVLFAVLSLTVFRMLPVAVSLIGTGMRARSVAFIGWFRPRGLASVVFGLLAVEDLQLDEALRTAITTLAMTVLLSVIPHGFDGRCVRRPVRRLDRPDPPADGDRGRHRAAAAPISGAVAPPTSLTPVTAAMAVPRPVPGVGDPEGVSLADLAPYRSAKRVATSPGRNWRPRSLPRVHRPADTPRRAAAGLRKSVRRRRPRPQWRTFSWSNRVLIKARAVLPNRGSNSAVE
jgi:hypothetical protein